MSSANAVRICMAESLRFLEEGSSAPGPVSYTHLDVYKRQDITPQTTMGEIRSNPSILGAGVWTYSKEQNLPGTEDWCND